MSRLAHQKAMSGILSDFQGVSARAGFSLALAPAGDEFGISFALDQSAVDRHVRPSSMVI